MISEANGRFVELGVGGAPLPASLLWDAPRSSRPLSVAGTHTL